MATVKTIPEIYVKKALQELAKEHSDEIIRIKKDINKALKLISTLEDDTN